MGPALILPVAVGHTLFVAEGIAQATNSSSSSVRDEGEDRLGSISVSGRASGKTAEDLRRTVSELGGTLFTRADCDGLVRAFQLQQHSRSGAAEAHRVRILRDEGRVVHIRVWRGRWVMQVVKFTIIGRRRVYQQSRGGTIFTSSSSSTDVQQLAGRYSASVGREVTKFAERNMAKTERMAN